MQRLCKVWELYSDMFTPPKQGWAYKEFKQGVYSYLEGLQEGVFTYRLIFAIKPS